MDQQEKIQKHKEITDKIHQTYIAKNADYGDSFAKLSNEYGPVYSLAHMEEKLERVKTLFKTNKNNVGEKISDTLLDLANYAILTAMQFAEIAK